MASRRRRRRRRRGRRRGGAPVGLVLASMGAVFVLAAAAFGYTRGVFDGLAPERSDALSGSSASTARFRGAEGIDLGDVVPPSYWWTDVDGQIDIGSEPTTDVSVPGSNGDQFQRVQVPADLLFEADSAELSDSAQEGLETIAATVTDESLKIIVVCHSSADGSEGSRMLLSEQRADALADALEALLARPAGSIVRIGKGDSEPLPGIDQSTVAGRALNRRCDVFIQFP